LRRAPSEDAAPWRQQRTGKDGDDDRIQWAGESHLRQTFRKKKDFIGEWTNVLFRA